MSAQRFVGVEEVLETGACQTRFEGVRGFGVFLRDLADEGGGKVAQGEVGESVGTGSEAAADEAGQYRWDDGGDLLCQLVCLAVGYVSGLHMDQRIGCRCQAWRR